MSAPVPEPPALVRSPEEGQHSGHEPGHVLTQLSAALENPDIRALEVRGNTALDMGVVMGPGFVPRCCEHGPCPYVSLVCEHGILMCAKIWGGGRSGKSSFLQRVGVPGAGAAPQKQKGMMLLPSLPQTGSKWPQTVICELLVKLYEMAAE